MLGQATRCLMAASFKHLTKFGLHRPDETLILMVALSTRLEEIYLLQLNRIITDKRNNSLKILFAHFAAILAV